ncbi:Protein of unknown function [Aliiroseovarius halocynthiae]|uniref:DUF3102 domain-containing protein n=1 Tax=Aliiroseovarius halocynthiae TaxID=985055 RepID=A0A545SR90_9RHOB|nr:DUF3102 domain-containing protein [Aliiroseovarius halocynthiae]TQV67488.1 DUF3102 domain-containing protein [Aliiroseovarius halocynthiae]SMR81497.1 Protein of unknown function [Aliiroseovarius halocynthiae]
MDTRLALTPDAAIASIINAKHRVIAAHERSMKKIAADIGEMLIEKKAELKHGEFIPWVEQWCSFSERHARNYIKIADTKRKRVADFEACASIREVLALGKTPKAPVQQTRSATLDDLRKVERLRALRDDPSATEGERNNAQRKLDEIEKEIGKVEPEKQAKQLTTKELSESLTKVALKKAPRSREAFNVIECAIQHTYGFSEENLQRILNILKIS